jgi:hypothetical protein
MDDKILMLLTQKVDERREQLIQALSDGSAKDFAEYRYMCGTIRGLSFAHSEIQDLVRRIKEYNDE